MKTKAREKLLVRLIDLRQRQEDRARSSLSHSIAEQTKAANQHSTEQLMLDALQASMPLRSENHHKHTAFLADPCTRLDALVTAMQNDRIELNKQRKKTRLMKSESERAGEQVVILRQNYFAAIRRRKAIAQIYQTQASAKRVSQELKQEDIQSMLTYQIFGRQTT